MALGFLRKKFFRPISVDIRPHFIQCQFYLIIFYQLVNISFIRPTMTLIDNGC